MKRETHHIFFNAENLTVFQVHVIHRPEFFVGLFLRAIDVGIVHVEATNPHQSKQLAALFVTIYRSIFRNTVWQVTVTFWFGRVYLMMMRTVHRPEIVLLP